MNIVVQTLSLPTVLLMSNTFFPLRKAAKILRCHGCNLHKSNKTSGFDVVSEETVTLFNPRKDIWNDHFVWAKGFTFIVGLTPIGRATVETLKLNREGLVNQRKVLYLYGEHPPE